MKWYEIVQVLRDKQVNYSVDFLSSEIVIRFIRPIDGEEPKFCHACLQEHLTADEHCPRCGTKLSTVLYFRGCDSCKKFWAVERGPCCADFCEPRKAYMSWFYSWKTGTNEEAER